jgi:hypothetical protein
LPGWLAGGPGGSLRKVPDHPRAARWDTASVLASLARATGIELADEGRCGTGQIGAAYVRWPDGHRSVLTCGPPGLDARRAGSLTAAARGAGIPAPRYELVTDLGELTAWPGRCTISCWRGPRGRYGWPAGRT